MQKNPPKLKKVYYKNMSKLSVYFIDTDSRTAQTLYHHMGVAFP